MSIDVATVRKIAALARLRIQPAEEERLARELQAILAYVDQLQALDLSGIEPTSQVTEGAAPAWRADEEVASDVGEEGLGQAPDRDGEFFRVPRVV